MKFWTRVLHLLDLVSHSPWGGAPRGSKLVQQVPLFDEQQSNFGTKNYAADYPRFPVPNGPGNEDFFCKYPTMTDWLPCIDDGPSGGKSRKCWLKHKDSGREFNISTNYDSLEDIKDLVGTEREYWLDVDHMELKGDGYINPFGKVFNQTYPGPWIQACWGDTLIVHVKNNLRWNGTTIHWHGLVQKLSTEMDGVNGISQCPIAPGETFTYKFRVTQYGTTWYHSHYSLQYGDGLLGPLTIFGPSSGGYDEAVDPIMMTDYNHRSAFEDFYQDLKGGEPPRMTNMLMNGRGRYKCDESDDKCIPRCKGNPSDPPGCFKPELYSPRTVQKGRWYLLRIINTSVDTTFVFSIDHHVFHVVHADLVAVSLDANRIQSHLLIGIGQRYHILVYTLPVWDEAGRTPVTNISASDMKFWMRTNPAKGCAKFVNDGKDLDVRLGVFRYDGAAGGDPNVDRQWKLDLRCRDEDPRQLKPVVPWYVDPPSNQMEKAIFQAGVGHKGYYHPNAQRWSLGKVPMWLNFSDPTILHRNLTMDGPQREWNETMAVIEPETYPGRETWIYLLVTSTGFPFSTADRMFVPTAHPIHLHGHDFAVLASSDKPYWPNELMTMNRTNPMRRDTALLPANGYLLIAFKADNPGVWIMHCHIAWHASSGFAIQIVERWDDLMDHLYNRDFNTLKPEHKHLVEGCDSWNEWFSHSENFWNKWEGQEGFQDDSGI